MKVMLLFFALQIIESKKHLRIVGGRDAIENEFPYVARIEILILNKDNIFVASRAHICTSAILTPDWTLTAAHCVRDISKLLKVVEILHNRTDNQQFFSKQEIKGVIWHGPVRDDPTPDSYSDIMYGVQHPAVIYGLWDIYPHNDIGLLRTRPIKINQYGKVSGLDAKSIIGQEVIVVGYGLTNSSYGNIYNTLVLKRPLQVMKVMLTSCKEDLLMYPSLCIARACGLSASLCPGDSGGPVIHSSGVVAINSMAVASDCFVTNDEERTFTVGTLTPVSPFMDWLMSFMTNNNT